MGTFGVDLNVLEVSGLPMGIMIYLLLLVADSSSFHSARSRFARGFYREWVCRGGDYVSVSMVEVSLWKLGSYVRYFLIPAMVHSMKTSPGEARLALMRHFSHAKSSCVSSALPRPLTQSFK